MEHKEAPVVIYTSYKRADGFEITIALRGDDPAEVMAQMVSVLEGVKKNGGTPISKGYQKSATNTTTTGAGGETKVCPKHKVDMKQNKNGKFYHSRGTYPDLEYCNGFGFPDEFKQPATSVSKEPSTYEPEDEDTEVVDVDDIPF